MSTPSQTKQTGQPMKIEEIRKALKDRRLNIVSLATGLHVNTIREVRDGKAEDPRHSTVQALSDYLEGKA